MRRKLFNFAVAVSLVLGTAMLVLWSGTYREPFEWDWTTTKGVEDPAWWRGQLCAGQGRIGYVSWVPESKNRIRYLKSYRRFQTVTPVNFMYHHNSRFDPWTTGYLTVPPPTNGQDFWCCGAQYSRFTDSLNHAIMTELWLPFWLIAVGLFTLPLAHMTLWLRGRIRASRHRARGRCSCCGYSLTGNTSGVCPECGTPVAAGAKL